MTSGELRALLRRVDPVAYPELASYSRDEVYGHGDQLSPGGLFLASRMARKLDLRPGDVVLDVGCGFGASSIFLADRYDVDVVALDIGVPASPISPMIATTLSTGTVSPSRTRISVTTPALGEGISTSTLSVDISKSGSSRSTVSPTCLFHRMIVPSVIDSPSCGISTVVGIARATLANHLSGCQDGDRCNSAQIGHLAFGQAGCLQSICPPRAV